MLTYLWLVRKLIIVRYKSHHRRRPRILVQIRRLVTKKGLSHVIHRQGILRGHGIKNGFGLVKILLGVLLVLNPVNVLDRGFNRKMNLLLIKLFGFVALLIYLKQLVVVPHDRVLVASELFDLK